MISRLVTCTQCKAILPGEALNTGEFVECGSCGAVLRVDVFPALFRETTVVLPQAIGVEGEASCFYHPGKKAVIPCDSCGRFLCALCDLEVDGRHVCPVCLETGVKKGKMEKLENRRFLPDQLAMSLVVFPLLLCGWPALVGAPMALYVVIRYWKSPGGITRRRTRTWLKVAAVLAILEIIGLVAIMISMSVSF